MKKSYLLAGTTALAMFAGVMPMHAQESTPAETETTARQDVIVISGRKREETTLEAPISVSAFSSEMLESFGANNAKDIADLTPGLQIDGDFGRTGERPVIRGISNLRSETPQPVGLFIDGVFVRSGVISSVLDNVERVEVLKGPQGALYGRSTYGGVINYITKKPSEEFEAAVSGTYAQHDQIELSGSVSGQVLPGINALAGGRYYEYGGEYDNINANSEGARKVGEEKTTALYGGLNFAPEGMVGLDANIRGYYSKDEDGQFAGHLYDSTYNNSVAGGGTECQSVVRSYFCGVVSTPDELNIATSIREGQIVSPFFGGIPAAWDFTAGLDREVTRVWGDISYDLTDDITLTYLGGYTDEESENQVNQSYSPTVVGNSFGSFPAAWVTHALGDRSYYSHELRLSGSIGDRIDWIVGGFFYNEESENSGRNIMETDFDFDGGRSEDETAFFGAVEFAVTDQFNLGVEAKRSERDIAADLANNGKTGDDVSKSEDDVQWRVTADYLLDSGLLLYANAGRGTKAGGFNSAIDPNDPVEAPFFEYDPEEATQYEIGFKADLDGRGHITGAVFRTDLTDQQLSQVVILREGTPQQTQETVVLNVGESEIVGFELDGAYEFTDNLTLGASWAMADSEITEGSDSTHGGIVGSDNLAGFKVPRVSKHSGNVMASYDFPEAGGWATNLRLDGIYSSSRYAQVHNLQETGDRFKTNARLTLTHEDSDLQFTVWGRNVFDDDTASNIFRYVDPGDFRFFARAHVVFMPRGRQFGVTMKKKF